MQVREKMSEQGLFMRQNVPDSHIDANEWVGVGNFREMHLITSLPVLSTTTITPSTVSFKIIVTSFDLL